MSPPENCIQLSPSENLMKCNTPALSKKTRSTTALFYYSPLGWGSCSFIHQISTLLKAPDIGFYWKKKRGRHRKYKNKTKTQTKKTTGRTGCRWRLGYVTAKCYPINVAAHLPTISIRNKKLSSSSSVFPFTQISILFSTSWIINAEWLEGFLLHFLSLALTPLLPASQPTMATTRRQRQWLNLFYIFVYGYFLSFQFYAEKKYENEYRRMLAGVFNQLEPNTASWFAQLNRLTWV